MIATVTTIRSQLGRDPAPAAERAEDLILSDELRQLIAEPTNDELPLISVPAEEVVRGVGITDRYFGILADSKGHLYWLVGAVRSDNGLLIQMVHGKDAIALVPATDITAHRYPRAWKIRPRRSGVPLRVGLGVLTASEIEHNFGEVMPNQKLNHTVTLTNSSDVPLVLEKPNTSCGCTTASIAQALVLEPGDSKDLRVDISSTNAASLKQWVFIKLTEPSTSSARLVKLSFLGSQRIFRVVSPRDLDFGTVHVGSRHSCSVLVRETAPDRFTITDVTTGDLPIAWQLSQAVDRYNLREYKILFTLDLRDTAIGRHRGTIVLHTDSDLSREIPIPTQFLTIPRTSASPSAIALGDFPAEQPQRRVVRLTSNPKAPLEVTVCSVPPELSIRVDKDDDEVTLDVTARVQRVGVWQAPLEIDVRTEAYSERLTIICTGRAH